MSVCQTVSKGQYFLSPCPCSSLSLPLSVLCLCFYPLNCLLPRCSVCLSLSVSPVSTILSISHCLALRSSSLSPCLSLSGSISASVFPVLDLPYVTLPVFSTWLFSWASLHSPMDVSLCLSEDAANLGRPSLAWQKWRGKGTPGIGHSWDKGPGGSLLCTGMVAWLDMRQA